MTSWLRSLLPIAALALVSGACRTPPAEDWPDPSPTPTPAPASPAPPVPYHQNPQGPWDLPGLTITVEVIEGGSGESGSFLPGDVMSVVFSLADEWGQPWRTDELTRFIFVVSGPTEEYQPLFKLGDEPEILKLAEHLGQGRYRYTFTHPIPEVYAPPYHDTPTFGPEVGEAQGQSIKAGTYTLLYQANISWDFGDEIHKSEADGVDYFRVLTPGELTHHLGVPENTCKSCHTVGPEPLTDGASINACMVCHTAGMEDGGSENDWDDTAGVTLYRKVFFHKLHMGTHLTQLPYLVRGSATPEQPLGFQYDFSFIQFPASPAGPATCDACHQEGGSPTWLTQPARAACGSCHDGVNFKTGEGHEVGGPQADDHRCAECHPSTGPSSIIQSHQHPAQDPTYNPGLHLKIRSVEGASGEDGTFMPGDLVSFTFQLCDDNGVGVGLSDLEQAVTFLSGPTTHLQPLIRYPDASDVAQRATSESDGLWRYTFSLPIPQNFAAPLNDTEAFGENDGEWQGRPLIPGTYSLGMFVTRLLDDGKGGKFRISSSIEVVPLRLLGATTVEERTARVDDATCEVCHQDMVHHGGARRGTQGCVLCHVAGAEDDGSSTNPTLTPGFTIQFPVIIHKVHHGQLLTGPTEVSTPAGIKNFGDALFPAWPDRTAQCQRCHITETWQKASGAPCLACHDSPQAASHVATNTQNGVESCEVCHGVGREQAVGPVHGMY